MMKKFTIIAILFILSIFTVSYISIQYNTNVRFELIDELNLSDISAEISDKNKCILINNNEHLHNILSDKKYLNLDYNANTYMISIEKKIKHIKKRRDIKYPFITHFVYVEQESDFSPDKIYVYEIPQKVYFEEQRNDNIVN